MYPKIHSGDCCLFEPVYDCDSLEVGDVVFCQVQPRDRYFAHKILEIGWRRMSAASASRDQAKRRYYIIGNNKGKENGWCYDCHIYGRLVEVIK